jgi:hypothetical protein
VLFFLRKNQLLKNGEAPVSMRITVNGQREEVRTKKSIHPDSWNQAKECSRARDKKSRDLNEYIESARIRIAQLFNEMEQAGKTNTAEVLIRRFFGKDDENRKTLLGVFKEHNEKCRQLIDIDYEEITIRRYDCCARYLGELIKEKYGQDDLLLKEVNGELVRSFEFYMKTERKCQQNTVIRYMKCFKKIINLSIANEWMSHNPFAGIKFHEVAVNKEFLTMEEINTIAAKDFHLPRLELVRDVFVFQCMTGLAFIDVYMWAWMQEKEEERAKREQEKVKPKSAQEVDNSYLNFKFFRVRKTSAVIAILGLLVFILTLFSMKQQNDYSLLMDEYYRQGIFFSFSFVRFSRVATFATENPVISAISLYDFSSSQSKIMERSILFNL